MTTYQMFFVKVFSSKSNQQPTTNNHNNQEQTLAIFVRNPARRFPENLRLPQVIRHGRLDHIAGTHRIIDTQRPQEHGNSELKCHFQPEIYARSCPFYFFLQGLGFFGGKVRMLFFSRRPTRFYLAWWSWWVMGSQIVNLLQISLPSIPIPKVPPK